MGLTRQEADWFLEKVLKIPFARISSSIGDQSKLALLNEIVRNFQQKIPFQSVSACAVPPGERHLPTWSEIKEDVFSGIGGLCYTLHVFMKELLSALGFEVTYVCASGFFPDDHITIIASDVSRPGSKHLVEVGCGYPTFQAIPLDFDTESPEYLSSFLLHKFVRRNDTILWLHEYKPSRGLLGAFQSSKLVDGWYRFLEIQHNKPRTIDFFKGIMTSVYTIEESSKLLEAPRIVSFPGGNLVAILANQKITGNDERNITKTPIEDKESLLAVYEEHFPTLTRDLVEDAIKLSAFTMCEETTGGRYLGQDQLRKV